MVSLPAGVDILPLRFGHIPWGLDNGGNDRVNPKTPFVPPKLVVFQRREEERTRWVVMNRDAR
jgi:hypothetical protein